MTTRARAEGTTRRRARARGKLFTVAALMVSAALAVPAGAPAQTNPDVTVREAAGVYHVRATFETTRPPAVVFAVLTDYAAIPRFMPDVKSSRVIEHTPSGVIVAQEATPKLMMFSKRVHLELVVDENPLAINFRDRCGTSFKTYEGSWTLIEKDGKTAVVYELTAKPNFDVPAFILSRLLKRDARRMIAGLQREFAARGAGAQAGHP